MGVEDVRRLQDLEGVNGKLGIVLLRRQWECKSIKVTTQGNQ